MRRSTLAVGLLLAVLFPIPSPAEDAAAAGDEAAASAPAAEGETKAAEEAPEAESAEAEEAPEAASEEPKEAAGEDAESSGEPEAAGEEKAAPGEASADAAEGEEGEQEEGGFGASLLDYARNTKTQFLTGVNGLVTGPADPVMATVNPPKAFDKASWPRRPLGFASGLLLMVYRTFTGTLDVALAPGPIPVMSPVPRYKLIPGFEHEDE